MFPRYMGGRQAVISVTSRVDENAQLFVSPSKHFPNLLWFLSQNLIYRTTEHQQQYYIMLMYKFKYKFARADAREVIKKSIGMFAYTTQEEMELLIQ